MLIVSRVEILNKICCRKKIYCKAPHSTVFVSMELPYKLNHIMKPINTPQLSKRSSLLAHCRFIMTQKAAENFIKKITFEHKNLFPCHLGSKENYVFAIFFPFFMCGWLIGRHLVSLIHVNEGAANRNQLLPSFLYQSARAKNFVGY